METNVLECLWRWCWSDNFEYGLTYYKHIIGKFYVLPVTSHIAFDMLYNFCNIIVTHEDMIEYCG
jgi:hypothetical protein